MTEMIVFLLVIFLGFVWLGGSIVSHASNRPQHLVGKVHRVVDGDSLYMAGHRAQIRLWGVDTPEVNQRGYVAAKSALIALADNEVITCQIMHRDKYGRTVARCYLPSGRDIGGELIRRDLARELRHFSKGYYSKRRL